MTRIIPMSAEPTLEQFLAFRDLTERRKSDRAELASLVTGMAERYGLSAVVLPRPESERRTDVSIAGRHGLSLTVAFDGNSPHRPAWDTHVLSWHGVGEGWRLRLGKFSRINPHHGHKATDVTHGSGELITLLERRFAAIADGSAFDSIADISERAGDNYQDGPCGDK